MNPVLSQLTDPKDEIDTRIHDEFMGMYMLSAVSRKQVEFKINAETAGRVYQLWLNAGICLLKANAHTRNFRKLLEEKKEEFTQEVSEANTGDKQHYYWDLSVEVEGMLTHLKAALDTFAILIGTVTNQNISGWSKKKPVGGDRTFSGQNIINILSRNLPANELAQFKPLIDFLEDNKEHISEIIKVRDGFTHPHGSFTDLTTGFFYDSTENKIIEPAVKFRNVGMLQSSFIDMAFNFTLETLIYSGIGLLNGIAGGMVIQYENGSYDWRILQSALNTDQSS